MKKRPLFFIFSLLAFFCFIAPAGLRAESTPEDTLKNSIELVRTTVAAEKSKLDAAALDLKLRAIIEPVFDFEEMSRSTLGPHWKKATPEEQKEFVALFSELLGRTYLGKIRKNIESSVVAFHGQTVRDSMALVRSIITYDGDEIHADYRLKQDEAKNWRVIDVIIENVGLISNYRNEFAGIIRKDQMSGLIAKIRADNLKKKKPADSTES